MQNCKSSRNTTDCNKLGRNKIESKGRWETCSLKDISSGKSQNSINAVQGLFH